MTTVASTQRARWVRRALSVALLAAAAAGVDAAPATAARAQERGKAAAKAPPGKIVEGALGKALDEAVRGFDAASGGFCGVVAVASKGKVVLQQGYGIADAAAGVAMPPDAPFDWASVSKQFTAALTLRVIELSVLDDAKRRKACSREVADALKAWKKLSLEDPLSRFFPKAPKEKAEVTIRQLLNHTSGIESGFKGEWQFDSSRAESLIELVLGLPMTSKPGTTFDYSNSGYAFVAALLEKLTGVTFEELLREQLFEPAGMKEAWQIGEAALPLARVPKIERGAGFTDRPADYKFAYGNQLRWGYRGCGGVVATTAAMVQWDRALRDGKYLSKASLEELYRPAQKDYALGWEVRNVRGSRRAEHSGGVQGVVAYCLRDLDRDFVVALICSYSPKDHPSVLADALAKLVEGAK